MPDCHIQLFEFCYKLRYNVSFVWWLCFISGVWFKRCVNWYIAKYWVNRREVCCLIVVGFISVEFAFVSVSVWFLSSVVIENVWTDEPWSFKELESNHKSNIVVFQCVLYVFVHKSFQHSLFIYKNATVYIHWNVFFFPLIFGFEK